MAPARAIARRTLRDLRVRTAVFAYLFAAVAYANAAGYRSSYPTLQDRLSFVHAFGGNQAVRLFYGVPHDLLTVGGYVAWRVGGTLAIFAAAWGMFAAVRALRAEEDAGRMELTLSGIVSRASGYAGSVAGILASAAILWLALFLALVVARLPAGGSAYLALSVLSAAAVFVGVGVVASQVASTRRQATQLASAVLGLAFLLRVVADTSAGAGWMRWLTALGWAEDMRPFAGPRPLVLVVPVAATAALLAMGRAIALRRDIGTGLLPANDSAPPRLYLLSSPTAQALRDERGSLLAWLAGAGFFAFILGVVSDSISSAGISKSLERQIAKLGAGSITTPAGYLGFTFLFFVFAVSLFVCSQVAAARREEADERLETLLALPVSRRSWLGGRLLLAAAGATAISLFAGALTWVGAVSQGVHISLPRLLEAGANCLPTALLFLGLGALAYALLPRAGAGIAYALVSVAFLWQLFGSLLGAPHWLLDISPFEHVAPVPARPFHAEAAAIMVALAALAVVAALQAFRRRDLVAT